MKTAVDLLVDELTRLGYNFKLYKREIDNVKEIESLFIMNAYNDGCIDTLKDEMKKGEDYYKEKFKKDE